MTLGEKYMSPPDSVYALWYYPDINRFADDDGNILHDLHELFDVWQLDEWKKTREYGLLVDRNGDLCELYYPEDDDENDISECPPWMRHQRQIFG